MKLFTKSFRASEEDLADPARVVVHASGGPSMLVYEVRVTGDEVEAFCFVAGSPTGQWYSASDLRMLAPFNVKLFTT